jgi:hypothetical protein
LVRPVQIAALATLLMTVSLCLWRLLFIYTDWAILALGPLAIFVFTSMWSLILEPWMARLKLELREDSTWRNWLTGHIRTFFLSSIFTLVSVTLIAWQALRVSNINAAILLCIFFVAALAFSFGKRVLSQHFNEPFARLYATSVVMWCVAIPATVCIALVSYNFSTMPGEMITADFREAFKIGLMQSSSRDEWISNIIALLDGYEAVKLWVVIQMRDYPVLGWLFSLDAAIFSFFICRTGIILAQFSDARVLSHSKNYKKELFGKS